MDRAEGKDKPCDLLQIKQAHRTASPIVANLILAMPRRHLARTMEGRLQIGLLGPVHQIPYRRIWSFGLGGRLIYFDKNSRGYHFYGCEEVCGISVVSGGDASELF